MYLILPAIFSLFIKLYLLYISRYSIKSRTLSAFTGLLAACALHSLCEAVGFSLWLIGKEIESLYRLYYVLSVWCLYFTLSYTIEVIKGKNWINYVYIAYTSVLTVLLLSTDKIISGYVTNGYILNANKSELYWLFNLFAFSLIGISISLLVKTIFNPNTLKQEKTQASYLLLGLLSPFLAVVTVITLIALGVSISSMAVIPIATTALFLFTVMSENKHFITDLKRSLPWSQESKAAAEYNLIQSKLIKGDISMKQATDEFQKTIIKYQKFSTDRNISEMARILQMSRSNLYQKMKDYNIK